MSSEERQAPHVEDSKGASVPLEEGQASTPKDNERYPQYDTDEKRNLDMHSSSGEPLPSRTRRKGPPANEGMLAVMCRWIVSHQIGKYQVSHHASSGYWQWLTKNE